jgi:cystathionine gamma-synthase
VHRRSEKKDATGLGTRGVWAGENGKYWERATQIPVALSVSFGYDDVNEWLAVAQGKTHGHIYSRNHCCPN